MNDLLKFTLYGNDYCHLCHEMNDLLKQFCEFYKLNYQIIWIELDDIENSNPDIFAQYELKVPVLLLDDQEICHYFLDINKLETLLINPKI